MLNNLIKIRKEKGMNLKKLSELTGLSVGYLSHLENGTRLNPSYKALNKIAQALDKNVEDII